MNLTEAEALVAYANQLDPRIQVNPATNDMWANALQRISYQAAQWVVRDYYSSSLTEGQPPTVTPQAIRRLAASAKTEQEARESARQALPPGSSQPLTEARIKSKIRDDPRFWEAFGRGRRDRADKLASKGIDPTPYGMNEDERREWEAVTGRTATR